VLQDTARVFRVGREGIHDGCVQGGQVCFTTVDGHLITFDVASGERRDLDLNRFLNPDDDRPLGWCRGVLPAGGQAWVGFTRIRPTLLRRNLSWLRHGFRRDYHFPTRITLYDLEKPASVREVDLESAGINAVFSIHSA
jgi:hypothetical protein